MKNVWIVDDDRSIRWVLEKALSREGLPWRSFENAIDVQNALENETPAVLVSDVRMPGESGLSLLKKIKAAHPQVPVIVMTGLSGRRVRISAETVRRRAGAGPDPPRGCRHRDGAQQRGTYSGRA